MTPHSPLTHANSPVPHTVATPPGTHEAPPIPQSSRPSHTAHQRPSHTAHQRPSHTAHQRPSRTGLLAELSATAGSTSSAGARGELIPFRVGGFSGILRLRLLLVGLAGLITILVVTACALTLGDYPITVSKVIAVFAGGGESMDRTVILQWRFGRLAAGIAVGFCLGLAGAITLTMARNSLVSPDVLGTTHGASCAAVLAFVFTGAGGRTGTLATHVRELLGISAIACIGALATALMVVLISRMGRGLGQILA